MRRRRYILQASKRQIPPCRKAGKVLGFNEDYQFHKMLKKII